MKKPINIFYKDLIYPIYNRDKICPKLSKQTPMRKKCTLDRALTDSYRDFLISPDIPLTNPDDAIGNEPQQFRVLAIERRYGMTSVLIKYPDNTSLSKLLLNPIERNPLKIW